ncbi:hypothetical protein Patl1_17693 [Pistacia atlantica]|uniref:Uncharacterized protein n=1 Tax=Pistacia atlantica TaxID=434234 RepID=A0ACC1C3Q8_9ROSI|nr:hypothetical protein Patl1_17693 [Pistacia atlantica]
MGGCCCCSSKGAERISSPAYYYSLWLLSLKIHINSGKRISAGSEILLQLLLCDGRAGNLLCILFIVFCLFIFPIFGTSQYPRASEEHVPLSSHHGGTSALSTGLLVDTNLDTSVPNAYRPPPAPIPFDVSLGRSQTPPVTQEICSSKSDAPVQTDPVQETGGGNTQEPVKCEDLKESESKTEANFEPESAKELEVELSKSIEPVVSVIEEDVCPTCLEEYDTENPRIITKCEHHFHLACILEWMERSDTCPVCDKEMIFDLPNE